MDTHESKPALTSSCSLHCPCPRRKIRSKEIHIGLILMTNKQVSWLHLSDLHIGQQQQWLWPNFKAIFLEDLRRLAVEAGPIDLVVFSGDLTQGGEKVHFDALTQLLLEIWELLDKLNQRPVLFAVPGNHDLRRPPRSDARVKMLARWGSDPDIAKEFWEVEDNQYIEVVRSAFSNYTEWQAGVSDHGIPLAEVTKGLLPGDVSSSLELNGVTVGLIGLNSSYLQLTDGKYLEKLSLDLRQLNALTGDNPPGWCSKHDVNFLVTHHPQNWLSTEALREFQTEIFPSGRFTAHLFGHMHDADLLTMYRGGDSGRKSFQGSSLFGMQFLEDGKTERVHGYSIGKIFFQEHEAVWRLWPRKSLVSPKSGDRKLIPDHENFELEPGKEYLSERLLMRAFTSGSAVTDSPRGLDLAVAVEESASHWNNALHGALYPLPAQEQHLAIRPLQQQACTESIRQQRMAWVCADWGLGRDGFLWSVIKRIRRDAQQVYLVSLSNYVTRDEFLTSFSTVAGCSFPEFCKALAASGPAILLFDEAPVSSGVSVGPGIERDAENLACMVRDFCPDIVVFLLTRTVPRDRKIVAVSLEPLDEADTRTYLIAHPSTSKELTSRRAVSEIFRRTDGLPGKIDSTLKTLRVVSLSELGLAASIGQGDAAIAHESVPSSLVKAVTAVAESNDPDSKRSYLLLKVLAVLPHGESLQRLKRIDHQYPIFPKHAEDLLDRDLIQVRSSTTLMGINEGDEDRIKILVAPRAVRDYVLSKIPRRELDSLVRKSVVLYFGDDWRTGKGSLRKLGGKLTSDDGSLMENPHTLILRLLGETAWDTPVAATQILGLCVIYCSALLDAKHYRNCVTVCRDILSMVPARAFESHRNTIDFLLAKALRMAGEQVEARSLFERLLKIAWSKDIRVQLLNGYALSLQSLDDRKALEVARELIEMAPKTAAAIQARSIILEMEADENMKHELLTLEKEARKRGFTTVANNLTLGRVSGNEGDPSSLEVLRQVYATALSEGDAYNAARAAVKIGTLSLRDTDALSNNDLNNLISAYQYFYGERFGTLFLNAHKALWVFFEKQSDIRNLLSLFRHSSFIWRLHGNEKSEQIYVKGLSESARQILSADVLTADKNTAYFLLRARDSQTGSFEAIGNSES